MKSEYFCHCMVLLALLINGTSSCRLSIVKDGHEITDGVAPGYGGIENSVRCDASCDEKAQVVTWFRIVNRTQEEVLDQKANPSVYQLAISQTSVLTITKMLPSDAGTYRCYAYSNKWQPPAEVDLIYGAGDVGNGADDILIDSDNGDDDNDDEEEGRDYHHSGYEDYRKSGYEDYRKSGYEDYHQSGHENYHQSGYEDYHQSGNGGYTKEWHLTLAFCIDGHF